MASFPEESPFLKFHSRDRLLVITACKRGQPFSPSPWVTSDSADMPTILSVQRGSWKGKMPFVCAVTTACPHTMAAVGSLALGEELRGDLLFH